MSLGVFLIFRLFVVYFFLAFSQIAHAAYPCPNGPGPGERQVGQDGGSNGIGVIPLCESNDVAGSAPAGPVWSSRWIAIATGVGTLGVGKDQPSKRKAQKAAVADCKAKGGAKCKVMFETYDQCLAFAAGQTTTGYGRADLNRRAEQLALQECSEGGDSQCRIYYSGCSFPVQIN